MKRYFYVLLLCLIFIIAAITKAQEKPIQLSLFNPIQIFPESSSIAGLRFNLIYGKNANVTGLDLGLVNQTTGTQTGVQWGGLNLNDGGFKGWQSGFVNVTKGSSLGLQTAAVNYHLGHFNGLQFSIVNYAETLKGLQIGLINVIGKGGFLPVFILFNFDFD
ncbi:MAG: hypothetical protein KJN64_00475 [Ignavibacteria bacterium]|nr:hypothetical protein [Ignavibacteria bacterium]MBT8381114.1 hypothetical protein [Ignavibacteria bacterium]MBT8392150.1 hypothetical protein [Ignavibacteria bacterium]NNJ53550.1 hypothetical protein [Ignavibacteriaceae bacterium]NNL21422.1 hypothetical protein [Ignavibacteriaceae bacterium]